MFYSQILRVEQSDTLVVRMKYTYKCPSCGETRTSPIKVTMSHECPTLKNRYPPSRQHMWASELKLQEDK